MGAEPVAVRFEDSTHPTRLIGFKIPSAIWASETLTLRHLRPFLRASLFGRHFSDGRLRHGSVGMTVTMRETVARGGTGSDTPTGMESRGIEFGVEIVAEEHG